MEGSGHGPMREINSLLKTIEQDSAFDFALATVIHVEGSAYRHVGAKMIFRQDGARFGTISAGCLEEDLAHHAGLVMDTHQSKIMTYDLRSEDDLNWGQGAGCNGAITVYIELITSRDRQIWQIFNQKLGHSNRVICAKFLSDVKNQIAALDIESGEFFGADDKKLQYYLQKYLHQNTTKLEMYKDNEAKESIMVETYLPKEKLYIFGAGPDVKPIAEMAHQLNFFVTVIDPRTSLCNKDHFPNVDLLMNEFPQTFIRNEFIKEKSYVLIMTHNFMWDREILNHFVNQPPYYLGILGPKKRTRRLLLKENVPDWIHSPIGLDIDAEGEYEISISIAAELIKARNLVSKVDKVLENHT